MTHLFVRTVCIATLLLGSAAAASAQGEGRCASAPLTATWGHTITGTIILPTGPAPMAAVGTSRIDALGELSGTQVSSLGGVVSHESLGGTIIMGADCTGTMNAVILDPSGNLLRRAVWALVLVDHGRELRGIMTSLELPNGMRVPAVVTMTAKKVVQSRGPD